MLIVALYIHSYIRWLIVAGLAVILTQGALAWTGAREYGHGDAGLLKAFSATMDAQLLLGIVLLFWTSATMGFPMMHLEHGITMLLAAAAAHVPARWIALPAAERGRKTFFTMLIAAALIAAGVAMLPQGWN